MWRGLQVNWGTRKKHKLYRFKHSLSTRWNANRSDQIFPEPWELPQGHLLSFPGHIPSSLSCSSSHSLSQKLQTSRASYLLHKSSLSVSGQAFTHIPHQQVRAPPHNIHNRNYTLSVFLVQVHHRNLPQLPTPTRRDTPNYPLLETSPLTAPTPVWQGEEKNLHLHSRKRKIWS